MSHHIKPASPIELLVITIMLIGVMTWIYTLHKHGLPLPW